MRARMYKRVRNIEGPKADDWRVLHIDFRVYDLVTVTCARQCLYGIGLKWFGDWSNDAC